MESLYCCAIGSGAGAQYVKSADTTTSRADQLVSLAQARLCTPVVSATLSDQVLTLGVLPALMRVNYLGYTELDCSKLRNALITSNGCAKSTKQVQCTASVSALAG